MQYQGYLNTPLLWKTNPVFDLIQLELSKPSSSVFNEELFENIVLGKRVERFVLAEFKQHDNLKVLLENVQIQNQKITVGEIDCILKKNDIPLHVEIVYKFYLFDPSIGNREMDCWIGPNRNDTLLRKLKKLKEKQLPLINSIHVKPVLDTIDVKAVHILPRVYFKAQLFTPYKNENINFGPLNKACLQGFYIRFADLDQLFNCTFYIPKKMDWLLEIQTHVSWISYTSFYDEVNQRIQNKSSPLCWLRFPNGRYTKFFVVWWGGE